MNKNYPKEDTQESKEGTAAHWVAWAVLANQPIKVGAEAPNGVIITDEMLDGADMLVDIIRSKFPDGLMNVEQTLQIPTIHRDCFGTPDTWGFDAGKRLLKCIDYKFGHRYVDEYENEQGILYIEGAMTQLSEQLDIGPGRLDQMITVEFTIVQPRCYYKGKPVRTWTFAGSDIRGILNDLRLAAELAYEPEPTMTTNSECGHCSGRHVCPAFQKAVYSDMEMSEKSLPFELPPEAASLELVLLERAMQRIQGRISGLEEVVLANIKSGKAAPFHTTAQTFGRQRWTLPDEQIIAIGQMYGKSLSKPGTVTPSQAIKLGVDESVIKAYSVVPPGGVKLVPLDSKEVSKVFNHKE